VVLAPLATAAANRALKLNVVCFMPLFELVDFRWLLDDALNQSFLSHEIEAVLDLVRVRDEQWVTFDERDADLDGREPAVPGEDNAADATRHAAAFEYEFPNRRNAAFLQLIHDALLITFAWLAGIPFPPCQKSKQPPAWRVSWLAARAENNP